MRNWKAIAVLTVLAVYSFAFIIMMNNFTNTVFGVAIQKSSGVGMWFYALLTLGIYVTSFFWARRLSKRIAASRSHLWSIIAAVLLLASSSLLVFTAVRALSLEHAASGAARRPPLAGQPNILLIGSDGLEAEHMSCYGYRRDTTPFLSSRMSEALVCENSFANCSHTRGSLTSLLTGRLPTETRVVYPPDILHGVDSFRHLPGILKGYGYETMHVSIRYATMAIHTM